VTPGRGRFEGLVDGHHPLREALVKVFKRRVFLQRGGPATGAGGRGQDGDSGSDAGDSAGSEGGGAADPTQLDDEAVAAADPALFTKARFEPHDWLRACELLLSAGAGCAGPATPRCHGRSGGCGRRARRPRPRRRPPRAPARLRRTTWTAPRGCTRRPTPPGRHARRACAWRVGGGPPRQGAAEAAPAPRAQAVAGEGRALQVLKAGRLNLLPASVTLSASAVRFAAAPGAAPRGAAGDWAPAVAPGPAAEGLVFEAAALDALAARSGELQAEHVRAVL